MRLIKPVRSWHVLLAATFIVGLLAGTMQAEAQPAQAQTGAAPFPEVDTTKGPNLSVNIGLASDYRFRGFTQTDGSAAVQGGADFTYNWFYAGAWATNVDFGEGLNPVTGTFDSIADYAIYSYAGARHKFGTTELDGGFTYYAYPNSESFADLDFYEFYGGISQEVHKQLTAGLIVYYSPDYQGGVGRNWIVEGSLLQNLPKIGDDWQPSVSGLLAYSDGEPNKGGFDYWYWNVGGSIIFHDYFEFDLRFFDTFDVPNTISCDDVCDGKVVARITFEN